MLRHAVLVLLLDAAPLTLKQFPLTTTWISKELPQSAQPPLHPEGVITELVAVIEAIITTVTYYRQARPIVQPQSHHLCIVRWALLDNRSSRIDVDVLQWSDGLSGAVGHLGLFK